MFQCEAGILVFIGLMELSRWFALADNTPYTLYVADFQTKITFTTIHMKFNYFIGIKTILSEYIPCITSVFPNVSIKLIIFCS